MVKVMVRLVADAVLVAMLLFVPAGTFAWSRARVLLAVLVVIRALGAIAVYRINPRLMRERAGLPMHREQSSADRLLLLGVLGTGFLGLPVIAGLDAFRWHALTRPAPSVVGLALWLQSYVAALGAAVPLALLMVLRLRLEERFLRRELPGYRTYEACVRFRLIPGIW